MPNRSLDVLYPPFRGQVEILLGKLAEAKLPFFPFMTLRTWEEQDALYAQGRTTTGKIVTNAPGGMSWHCYGLALDLVLDGMPEKPGLQWSWETKHADFNKDGRNDWLQMAEIAVSCGLESGYFWKKFPDLPHVENRYGLKITEAREIYRQNDGDIKAVWAECKAA
jgi:peptidoglycan L-alanyl-D-glutamate endopeptidase CwlK